MGDNVPIHRAEHKENFTQILNNLLNDSRLSYGARGLMAYALTHYDDWVFNGENYFVTDKDKLSKVKRYLNELIEYGYLKRYQEKSNTGTFGSIMYIFIESPLFEKPLADIPLTEKPITENQTTEESLEESKVQPIVNLPLADIPLTDSPLAENHTLNNTNITNTNNYIYSDIFDLYLEQGIIKHSTLTNAMKKAIDKTLKKFTIDNIKLAITRYGTMYRDKDNAYANKYCKYKWTLQEFLTREKGISEFLDEGGKWIRYKDNKFDYIEDCNSWLK